MGRGGGGGAAWDAIVSPAVKRLRQFHTYGWLGGSLPLRRPHFFRDCPVSRTSYPFVGHPVLSNVYLTAHTSWDGKPPVLCALSPPQKKQHFRQYQQASTHYRQFWALLTFSSFPFYLWKNTFIIATRTPILLKKSPPGCFTSLASLRGVIRSVASCVDVLFSP